MKRFAIFTLAATICGFVSQARAEDMQLTCVISSAELPQQNLVIQVRDGRIFYGATASSLVSADTIDKGSLAITKSRIAFKQSWADTKVQWDWNIDLDTGDIGIRYINLVNKKQFLQKKGSCS
ncbi:hypothetical protein [Methylocystis heyeri]|uniref:DUF2541 family protein n=1 Tax=Methylocystis heyeri TaxID=391905 RepID=A0A6B8KCJ0_9HYPH|nr:hypothetical protein [Methylocystis heyeri]QGM45399.1 hypothetical protein H2LOC_006640 [Methylocystis heyeri]